MRRIIGSLSIHESRNAYELWFFYENFFTKRRVLLLIDLKEKISSENLLGKPHDKIRFVLKSIGKPLQAGSEGSLSWSTPTKTTGSNCNRSTRFFCNPPWGEIRPRFTDSTRKHSFVLRSSLAHQRLLGLKA